MALRALMLRKKIDLKKKEADELRKKLDALKKREEELTISVDEVSNEEEQKTVEEAVDELIKEKESLEASVDAIDAVITELEGVEVVLPSTVERFFTADLAFLQDMYQRINNVEPPTMQVVCPDCGKIHEVPINFTREG